MNIYSSPNLIKSFLLLCIICKPVLCVADDMIPCNQGMIANGVYYKASSLVGISVSNQKVNWLGGGRYSISMNIVANQGVKKWYSSTNAFSWVQSGDRSGPLVGKQMRGCSSGLVVAAQQVNNNVKIGTGTGTVTLTAGAMGGKKGTSFVLYDEKLDGFITMSNIGIAAPYAVGYSKEDDAVTRFIGFSATFSNIQRVADGNYTVNVIIPIGATTTWFPSASGYNYWWATSMNDIPLSYAIIVPVKIRTEDQKPVNPVAYCTTPSSLTLDHGTLSPGGVNDSLKRSSIAISCNTSMSGNFEIIANDNSSTAYAKADMGKGVTSTISASRDGTNWYRKLSSFRLNSGANTLQVQSILNTSGVPTAGEISSSAVIVINYN